MLLLTRDVLPAGPGPGSLAQPKRPLGSGKAAAQHPKNLSKTLPITSSLASVGGFICKDRQQPRVQASALDLFASLPTNRVAAPPSSAVQSRPSDHYQSAADRVIAAELQARGAGNDALAMMVNSMLRMVQAGKSSDSRWKAG